MIIDQVKEEYVKDLLKQGKRVDGRGLLDYREIRVEKGLLQNAEGSALAHVGDTKVLAGVKFDLMTPFPDRPNEGVVMFNSEFSPLAHPEFQAGPPDERSIELARVIDRGIRSADVIDVNKLALTGSAEGKVLGVFVDLYTLDHSGNLIDAAGLASMAALASARVPKVEGEKLVRTEFTGSLEIKRRAVTTTFNFIDGTVLLDATDEEEIASDGRVSIGVTDDGFVCAGQKAGAVGVRKEKLMELVDIALMKGKELARLV